MNKFNLTLSFCLIFLLFSSCAPDLTDDVEMAYEIAARNNSDSDYTDTEDSSSGSCKTIDGYMWSSKSSDYMTWDDAVSYCDNLTECGYSNWHLPTISELRTLIQNCSGTVTGGSCGVTDSCLSDDCCNDACWCESKDGGYYSKLGDDGSVRLWSSSTKSDSPDYAWVVYFNDGYVGNYDKSGNFYVRCVR